MITTNGEVDLHILLSQMQPVLAEEEFVFCTLSPARAEKYLAICQGFFREKEGITLILAKNDAELDSLTCSRSFRKISLMVHSSLEAVGFLARITEVLAAQGISVNVISGYYHDHLFVRADQAEEVLHTLELWQTKLRE
jgi:hypothetical protein